MNKHNIEEHQSLRLAAAFHLGASERFYLFNTSGQVLGMSSHNIYDLDEIVDLEIEDRCEQCGDSFHYVAAPGGRKGVLIKKIPSYEESQA